MVAPETSLMERVEEYFCDAFVTFGTRGDDLVLIAQKITMAGKMAGLTKRGRRRMLDHLYAFIDTLPQIKLDPFAKGRRVVDPASLFAPDKLGSIFDGVSSDGLAEQADLFGVSQAQYPQERALIEHLVSATKLCNSSEAKAGQFFGEEHSPLAYVGYKVGKTNGLSVQDRRRLLRVCFQIQIPYQLADRYQAWGSPASYRRLTTMCQHIAMLADMRRKRRNYEVAVADWDADLKWFRAEYAELSERLRRVGR